MIAIPGGMPGAERIRDSVRLHPALEKHWRAMRPLAMICATPAVLGEPKGFLEGVAATSHPAFIDEIGGSWSCVEINQCVGCTLQFFTKLFLSGEERAPPRHRAGVASMAWRTTRRFSTNAP